MAKTKSKAATAGRDSKPKYLGVKIFAGQKINVGQVIVRQKGTKFLAGKNVKLGRDDTIYALKPGVVQFKTIKKKGFEGSRRIVKVVDVISTEK